MMRCATPCFATATMRKDFSSDNDDDAGTNNATLRIKDGKQMAAVVAGETAFRKASLILV